MGVAQYTGIDPNLKALGKLIDANARRHRRHEVFRDFCELSALAISNSVDLSQFDAREARYLEIVGRYEREEVERFPQMLAHLIESLEGGMHDAMGSLFMSLELGDHWKGQYFTPYEVSRMMAMMTLTDAPAQIERKGFITVCEPACGAGAMVIACAHALHDQKINYQQAMHVTTIDIDPTAVHMAYIQFSLLHIPAIVIHGNALTVEEWGHFVTPAHVLGRWDWKLYHRDQVRAAVTAAAEIEAPELAEIHAPELIQMPAPMPAPAAQPEQIDTARAAIVAKRVQAEQLSLFG